MQLTSVEVHTLFLGTMIMKSHEVETADAVWLLAVITCDAEVWWSSMNGCVHCRQTLRR